MTPTTPRPVMLAALVGFALTLAGCSSSANPAPEPRPSPITELMREFDTPLGSLEIAARSADERNAIEEGVAACMAEQGFEYTPVVLSGPEISEPDWGVERGTREFAEQYGYGYSTDPSGSWFAVAADVPDPNAERVATMSASEQGAYLAALYGDPNVSAVPTDAGAGCVTWATTHTSGALSAEPWEGLAGWRVLNDAFTEILTAVNADNRFLEAKAGWLSCMADAGFASFTDPDEPSSSFFRRVAGVWGNFPFSELPEGPERRAELNRIQQQLTELRPEEISVAVADFDCRAESGYQETFDSLISELEQQYYESNRTELDALRAALLEWQAEQ